MLSGLNYKKQEIKKLARSAIEKQEAKTTKEPTAKKRQSHKQAPLQPEEAQPTTKLELTNEVERLMPKMPLEVSQEPVDSIEHPFGRAAVAVRIKQIGIGTNAIQEPSRRIECTNDGRQEQRRIVDINKMAARVRILKGHNRLTKHLKLDNDRRRVGHHNIRTLKKRHIIITLVKEDIRKLRKGLIAVNRLQVHLRMKSNDPVPRLRRDEPSNLFEKKRSRSNMPRKSRSVQDARP